MEFDVYAAQPFDRARLACAVEILNARYPTLKFNYLGNSILGHGIPLLTLGEGRRRVLYVGAHHGMEWITSALLTRFLFDLCDAHERDLSVNGISVRLLLQTHTLYVVPMLNPDGVNYQIHGVDESNPLRERLLSMNGGEDFSRWQANARGVDLNHNYDADFYEYRRLAAENGITEGAPTRYAGEAPESEPEVASLCNLIRYHAPFCGALSLHTQGEEIYYGASQDSRVRRIAEHLSKLCGYRVATAEGLASMSGMTDWCTRVCKIPAFTLECGKGVNPLPLSCLSFLYLQIRSLLFQFPTLL